MNGPLVVGVDIGTTKTKAAAFDLEGRMLAGAAEPYPSVRPRPGWVEQDADDYWDTVAKVIGRVGGEIDLEAVAAVGVCSQVNTHVLCDERGRPLRPAITWQDQRCAQVAADLDADVSDEQRAAWWGSGFRVDASNLLARAEWVRRNESDTWARARWILSPKDYVNLRLTGQAHSDPLSSIGLVESGRAAYLELDALVKGVSGRLPPLADVAQSGGLTGATAFGLPAGIPVAVGTMDAWASAYGSGVTRDGEGFEVSGTSEILGLVGNHGPGAAGVVGFPPYRGMHLFAGPTQAGGDALRWFSEAHGKAIPWTLEQAARAPAGCDGVVFLPHLAGERAPLWDPELRGGFVGLGLEHGEHHLCRAVLEGVAFAARQLLEALEEAAARRPLALALSGGGAASDLWSEIKADVLGRRLARLEVLDSGVLGAALFAGVAGGHMGDLESAAAQMVRTERVFEPDDDARTRGYDGAYEHYRAVQAALTPVFHARARGGA